MRPDEAQHVAQLQRSAAELARFARDLAAATPPSVEGSDPTGWVHVVLGPDGIPTEVRVREGWQQRVDPARLAGAVMDANLDAVQRAMQAWTVAMQESDWRRSQAGFEADAGEDTAGTGHPLPKSPFGHVRDTNELAEEVLSRLHAAQTQPAPSTAAEEPGSAAWLTSGSRRSGSRGESLRGPAGPVPQGACVKPCCPRSRGD